MTACARCRTALEDGDLRCAICALPAPHHLHVVPDERLRARVLRCLECGAATAFSPLHGAPACKFCGALMQVETPHDPLEVAEIRVPFAVDRERARAALRGWLGTRGWFAPHTLGTEAAVDALHPLWWAAWLVDAEAAVAWTADSDHGAARSAWAPHAGEVAMHFERLCVPASRGLELGECDALAPYYTLADAVPADAPVDEGTVEAFDAQRSAARHLVQKAIEAEARERVEPFIPGRRVRKVKVACLVESQQTRRVALPAWAMVYRFRGRPYRAIVHGQRAEIVVGSVPVDWRKLAWVAAIVVALAAAVALLV